MKRAARMVAIVFALAQLACGRGDEAAPPAEESPREQPSGMRGMRGMEMMGRMQTHMQRMATMRGDSLEAVVPVHRQMVGNMLAQMNREMRDMGMDTDEAWDATVDSIRSDLTRMPRMDTAELDSLMPGHRDRVMRLMRMHAEMMQGM